MTSPYLLRSLNSSIKNYQRPAQHSFDGTLLLIGDRLSWLQSGCGDRTTRDRCAIRARGLYATLYVDLWAGGVGQQSSGDRTFSGDVDDGADV